MVDRVWALRIWVPILIAAIQKDREKTQILPSLYLIYYNSYWVINVVIKTNKKQVNVKMSSLL